MNALTAGSVEVLLLVAFLSVVLAAIQGTKILVEGGKVRDYLFLVFCVATAIGIGFLVS